MSSTKSREVIWGGRIGAAKINAESARQRAKEAAREADRAEAYAWSLRMEGYGGPARPSPTIAQCLNAGYGWLEVKCRRCETKASIPLEAVRRSRDTAIRVGVPVPVVRNKALQATGSHDKAYRRAGNHAVQMGASRRLGGL
jgi:hypothetical protein